MFQAFDGDKSGSLDFTELSAIIIMETGSDDEQSMELVFKVFDSNGDNKVDAKELESVLKVSDCFLIIVLIFIKIFESIQIFCELNKEDMEQGGEDMVEKLQEQVAGIIIAEYDKDNDGKLSKDEFLEAFCDISKK